eukprot:TRINITY_DN12296_c0_g1_i1.p1 TRINITY_DN12296_c0_g1~~TRINITY_DN12296_c0_g1_i1.p1  ORF type:complete len:868 (+),score=153.00 TRINITY_DN12296_c0_g1_i1:66-2669(+)
MRIAVSAELHGKQHKVEVQLVGKGDLGSVKDEIERALQTQIFLKEKGGGLGIRIEELQFYDVRSYCWVPVSSVDTIEDRCQLYAVVKEREGSHSPARSARSAVTERRERTLPPSPLTKLPQPKELPSVRRNASPSPSRVSIPLRGTSPFRSQSPSHLPRYVPPPMPMIGGHERTARTPTRRDDSMATAWQTESAKKAFRGYLVGPDGTMQQPATPRNNSPSPFSRMTREEFSSIFPLGSCVYVKTGGKEEKGQVVGHTTSGNVEVQTATGAVIQMHPSTLRISEQEGYCVLQQKPHDCELSPGRLSRRSMEDYMSGELKGEGFLRDSMEAQSKVFNHTIAKHQSILVEERTRREAAERKLAHLKSGVVVKLIAAHSSFLLSRYFMLWRRWCGQEHWNGAAKHLTTPAATPGGALNYDLNERAGSPVISHAVGGGVPVEEVRHFLDMLGADVERAGGEFGVGWADRLEVIREKFEEYKAKLNEQSATIAQQNLLIGAYRHDLRIPHEPVDNTKCSHCGGPPTPAQPALALTPSPPPAESPPPSPPASPLATEISTLHSQIAELRRQNGVLKEKLDRGEFTEDAEMVKLKRDNAARGKAIAEKDQQIAGLEKLLEGEKDATRRVTEDFLAAQERINELEHFIRTRGLDAASSAPLPWGTEEKEDPVYAAAKRNHKMAVERAVSSTKKTPPARGRVMSQSAPKKRTGSMKGDVPVQASHYPVGTEVIASNLNGTTFRGRVVGHNHGRVEVETADGTSHKLLPSRIKSPAHPEAQTPTSTPSTPRGQRAPAPAPPLQGEPEEQQSPLTPLPTPPSSKREREERSFVHTSTPSMTPGEDEVVLIQMVDPGGMPSGNFKLDGKKVTPRRKAKK